ncbi:MAG: glutamate-1-semialdehyde 2,1-aminomutase [Vampirovibrio sp.]|nr:glutamate-1-semialdehyde 2,1-aminomutase [Vampirovibrio sp.]
MSTASTTVSKRTRSQEAFTQAQKLMPGGVNSPVRAYKSVGGTPPFIQKAQGSYVWDIDENQYIDYIGSWGPAILGHGHPQVVEAVQQTAEKGLSFGAPTLLESELAQAVIDRVPSIEKVRFVNSGTEAVMSAVRLARAYTGREKIIKFAGCYHGHSDYLLVKAGSGALTLGVPDSPGVPKATANETLIATFNDLASVKALLNEHGPHIAGILVEPVAGNMGCIPPEPGFLEGLRSLANEFGALLLFDEVMTGFRVALGGAQQRYEVMPDITMLGKIVGGGMPVGAYGGKAEIMSHVAPEGSMYQAGTLSGNPLGMAAGLKTLELISAPDFYTNLESKTEALSQGVADICRQKGIPACITQVGSMWTVFFTDAKVTDFDTAMTSDRDRFTKYFWSMLDAGIYLAPSPFEAAFVSAAHTQVDIDETLKAVEKSL